MLCDNCKNKQATYHAVREINGYKSETHLCEECRRKKSYNTDFSLFDSLFGGFASLGSLGGFDNPSVKGSVCQKCGTTLKEYYDSGLLGCENCYEEFGSNILPQLKQTQAKVSNEGKNPEKKKVFTSPEYEKIKKELAKAVEEEEYGKAAELHDKLKKMEQEGV